MNNELYLKTAFCCMACDGDIASEEVDLIKSFTTQSSLFDGLNVEELLNNYISSINASGMAFLNSYFKELKASELSTEQQLQIIKVAIEMIEADNEIQYSEVKFFKRIRKNLSIEDDAILAELPDKKDYLLPDIAQNEYEFILNTQFAEIKLDISNAQLS